MSSADCRFYSCSRMGFSYRIFETIRSVNSADPGRPLKACKPVTSVCIIGFFILKTNEIELSDSFIFCKIHTKSSTFVDILFAVIVARKYKNNINFMVFKNKNKCNLVFYILPYGIRRKIFNLTYIPGNI